MLWQFPWPVFPRTNLNLGIIEKFYDPWPPWPNHIMETILIIYQQYNVHFYLKQDSDLKIPLNGLKTDQLDQIWFRIKRKISFKLTWKIGAEFILELLLLTSPKIKLCRVKTAQKIFLLAEQVYAWPCVFCPKFCPKFLLVKALPIGTSAPTVRSYTVHSFLHRWHQERELERE